MPLINSCIVRCQGDVQLGGPMLGSPWLVPLRLRLLSLFYSLKRSPQGACAVSLSGEPNRAQGEDEDGKIKNVF